jgi:cytochrome c oxidase subunit 2
MEIHRYEKLWFGASLVLIVAFIATIAYGAVGAGIEMINDDGGTIDPENTQAHEHFNEPYNGSVTHVEGDQYRASVQAFQFGFLPDPIEVPEGSTVTFYLTSLDVTHGFNLIGTNVNTMVIPGQVAEFTVEFDEPGEYGIICNEFCGAGHASMEGQLIVVPESEWEGEG